LIYLKDVLKCPLTDIGYRDAMDRFIRRENVKHYRELLKKVKDEAERQKILKLLAEEQQKQKDAGDKIEDEHE
jgi:hypothetical protein